MLGAMKLYLVPFPSLGIFLHAFLVLVVKARVTGICSGCCGAVVIHLKHSNSCQKLLVLQVQCIHLFSMLNLLLIWVPFALGFRDSVRSNSACIACSGVSLDVRWGTCCIECSVVVADHTHCCRCCLCSLFSERIQLVGDPS